MIGVGNESVEVGYIYIVIYCTTSFPPLHHDPRIDFPQTGPHRPLARWHKRFYYSVGCQSHNQGKGQGMQLIFIIGFLASFTGLILYTVTRVVVDIVQQG